MDIFANEARAKPELILIAGAAVVLYISAKAAADALIGGRRETAGRLAIGHWLPIAVVALTAMMLGHSEIAIGVVFATSVASLSLGVGSVAVLSPEMEAGVVSARGGAILLPVAVLVFLAGFRGELTILHACILAFEGWVISMWWMDSMSKSDHVPGEGKEHRPPAAGIRAFQFMLAFALAGLGGWAVIRGIERASRLNETASTGLLAATLLSPLLVLPILGKGVDLAHAHRSHLAISMQITVPLLNLCLLLPLVVVEAHYQPIRLSYLAIVDASNARAAAAVPPPPPPMFPTSQPGATTQPAEEEAPLPPVHTLPFPLAVWRVDTIMLIAVGLFLLPVAFGRWNLSKGEGFGLIFGFVAYLLLTIVLGLQVI